MKPFDLEAAKRGEPVCARDGTPVQQLVHFPEGGRVTKLQPYLVALSIPTTIKDGITAMKAL